MLTTMAPCTILVTCKSAGPRLREMAERFHADVVDPMEYRCCRCGLEWDDSPLRDYREVVCSNCYSERVVLTMVRLGFDDWGPQNGGSREQSKRLKEAERILSTAMRAIRSLKGS